MKNDNANNADNSEKIDRRTSKYRNKDIPTKNIKVIDLERLRTSNLWGNSNNAKSALELYQKQVELVNEARLILWRGLRGKATPLITDEQREDMIITAVDLLDSGKFVSIDAICEAMDIPIQTFYTYVRHDARFAQCFDRLNESKVQAIKDKAIQAAVSGEELPNFREVALVLNSLDHNKIVFSASSGSGQSFVLQFANSSAPQEAVEVVKAE